MLANVPHWTNPIWARVLLPVGLLAGFLLPELGRLIQPTIPVWIGVQLFIAGLTIDWNFTKVRQTLLPGMVWVLVFQFLVPSIAAIALAIIQLDLLWRIPILFVLAAAPLTGSPNMVAMLGRKPQHALALLILGTAFLPVTALPMLWTLQSVESTLPIWSIAIRLLVTIFIAITAAIVVRKTVLSGNDSQQRSAVLNLVAASLLAIVVIGLMSGFHQPGINVKRVAQLLFFVCVLNISLHAMGYYYGKFTKNNIQPVHVPVETAGISTGNRNVALLLTALPAATLEPHLLFLACFQIPMYLTPIVSGRIYRR